jgi:hypothetical protein
MNMLYMHILQMYIQTCLHIFVNIDINIHIHQRQFFKFQTPVFLFRHLSSDLNLNDYIHMFQKSILYDDDNIYINKIQEVLENLFFV